MSGNREENASKVNTCYFCLVGKKEYLVQTVREDTISSNTTLTNFEQILILNFRQIFKLKFLKRFWIPNASRKVFAGAGQILQNR
jgi:hypothetical protein